MVKGGEHGEKANSMESRMKENVDGGGRKEGPTKAKAVNGKPKEGSKKDK